MKHFLDINQLSYDEAWALIQRALYFKKKSTYPCYNQYPMATLFYENSTRTRISFELAASHLGMPVMHLDLHHSSEAKGELIQDTVKTLSAMRIKLFVVRHKQEGLPAALATACDDSVHVINAGDGKHAHPTQAMLDLMTILEKKPDLSLLKITIVGNLRHSRVANSLQQLCALLGVGELLLVSPEIWQPERLSYGRVTTSLQEGLAGADVVICLRVQQERLFDHERLNLADYHRDYGLTKHTLAYAKPDAMVMHPGPINRGVEIDSDVADGAQSCILDQVENGVFMRMAVLEALVSG